MSQELMSVEGQLVGMPLAGPESFSQQQLDYLKRALGVDETVLYNNTSGAGTGTSIELSEDWNLFEKIRVETVDAFGNGAICGIFDTASYSVAGARVKRFPVTHTICVSGSPITMYIRDIYIEFANGEYKSGTLMSSEARVKNGAVSEVVMSGASTKVTRVVGIHRIAGGN